MSAIAAVHLPVYRPVRRRYAATVLTARLGRYYGNRMLGAVAGTHVQRTTLVRLLRELHVGLDCSRRKVSR